MIVRRAEVLPIECVVRGYLYGSAWREYAAGGGPTTEHLPPDCVRPTGSRPDLHPGHEGGVGSRREPDESKARSARRRRTYEAGRGTVARPLSRRSRPCRAQGVILADTKFEFGFVDGDSPSSTRCSHRTRPATGRPTSGCREVRAELRQAVRPGLAGRVGMGSHPARPDLPDDVVVGTRERYVEAFERITGPGFDRLPGGGGRMNVTVTIRRRPVIADPHGATVARALADLGHPGSARAHRPHHPPGGRRRRCRDGSRAGWRRCANSSSPTPCSRTTRSWWTVTVAVVVFPGSNCEHDVVHAIRLLGGEAELVWHRDTDLSGADAVVLPRRVRPRGRPPHRRHRPLLARDAARGSAWPTAGAPVLGICNGFQILCEAGLLPGRSSPTATCASSADGRCRGHRHRHDPHRGATIGQRLRIPLNSYEGNWVSRRERVGSSCDTSTTRTDPRIGRRPSPTTPATSSGSCPTPSAPSRSCSARPTVGSFSRASSLRPASHV
jgi:hypothetical protein